MKKAKDKVELRYYDIPQNEFLITLVGDSWVRQYGVEGGPLHFHNLLEIGVCRRGGGTMCMENEEVPYTEGMISIVPANFPHSTVSESGKSCYWEYLFIDTEKMLLGEYPEDLLFRKKLLERINKRPFLGLETSVPEISNLVNIIIDEMRNKQDALYKESVRGLALSLLIQVARVSTECSLMPEGLRVRNSFEQVRPALAYIREHYDTHMRISDIADVCHMSESHFRRLFEENIGMTPVEYLNHIRVRKACDFISKTGNSMEEIASKVGFATTSTFNRNFKRITGTSPYQWKKQPDNFESRLAQFNILIEKGW